MNADLPKLRDFQIIWKYLKMWKSLNFGRPAFILKLSDYLKSGVFYKDQTFAFSWNATKNAVILLMWIFNVYMLFIDLLKKSLKKNYKKRFFLLENYFYNFSCLCFTRGNLWIVLKRNNLFTATKNVQHVSRRSLDWFYALGLATHI